MQEEIKLALEECNKLYKKKIADNTINKSTGSNKSKLLTERELQCLVFISEGMNIKEVARKLYISGETVSTHTGNSQKIK